MGITPPAPRPLSVGVYQEPAGPGIGGSEFLTAAVARAFRDRGHAAEIVCQRDDLDLGRLEVLFGTDLSGVRLRRLPRPGRGWFRADISWPRQRADQRAWNADLSAPYDLFVSVTHGVPPYCHAPAGVLYVLFPTPDLRRGYPFGRPVLARGGLKAAAARAAAGWLWRDRLATYRVKLAISHYTADWTRRIWGGRYGVVHPPVRLGPAGGAKDDLVVSLGRFCPMKKQREMVRAFAARRPDLGPGWGFACLGGLSDAPDHIEYFAGLRAGAGPGVALVPNAPVAEVNQTLARAKVFWHGAGAGEDEAAAPDKSEHFGIATVEAMAAGCVPVVLRRGGQPEIVEHGVSGLLCESVDEMADATVRLARDDARRAAMAAAAVVRAAAFAEDRFAARFLAAARGAARV